MNKPSEKTREDQPSKKTREDLLLENIELHRENRLLKKKIKDLILSIQSLNETQTTPMYKPRRTDYDKTSCPEMEELHDTVQIIRDSSYARQMASTPEPLTVREHLERTKQILQDSILARQLSFHL